MHAHEVDRDIPNLSSGAAEARGLFVCVMFVSTGRLYMFMSRDQLSDHLPAVGNIEQDCVAGTKAVPSLESLSSQ